MFRSDLTSEIEGGKKNRETQKGIDVGAILSPSEENIGQSVR